MSSRKTKKKNDPSSAARRSAVRIGWVIGLCMALAVSAIGYTMVSHKHLWSGTNALNTMLRSSVLNATINGERGQILDRTGQVIAQQTDAYTLLANFDTRTEAEKEKDDQIIEAQRRQAIEDARANNRTEQVEAALEAADAAYVGTYVEDPDTLVAAVKSVLGDRVDEDNMKKLIEQALENNKSQISLGPGTSRISRDLKERLEAMKIPGLSFGEDVRRDYPTTPYSSNLIGFAAYDDSAQNLAGKLGIEQNMDIYLAGKNGKKTFQATRLGQTLAGSEHILEESENGDHVKLTIDSNLQQTVEQAVQQTMNENNAASAWCLVMDPETGRVLAWASYPTFDQNQHDSIPSYNDWISQSLIEPGSVIKPLIYSMALDAGVYPYNEYYRAGSFAYTADPQTCQITRIADSSQTSYPVINDAMGTDYGTLTFAEGLAHSSNIAICELLSNYLSKEKVESYIDAYRLFDKTGINFVSESAGNQNTSSPSDYLSSGFGQASSLTMLELCQAYTAIFNDGVMMKPYVVDSIIDSTTGQTIQKFRPETAGVPISAQAASETRKLMQGVVAPGMTGERFAIDGVDMALKTGTGEIFNTETHTYDRTNYTSSVVAAAPADDPKVMVCWGMQSANYLNYSAAPFQTIMTAALKTANVNTGTDRSVTEEFAEWNTWEMPSLISHSVDYAQKQMEDKQVNTVFIGDGDTVVGQFPAAGTSINTNDNVLLLTNGSQRLMPDMIGWTRKDLTAYWQLTGISISSSGFGRTAWQSIPAETPIEPETVIEVRLE